MGVETIFAVVGVIILFGFLSDWIFSKTNIPDVLWLILIGLFLGPVFKLINPDFLGEAAAIFTSFALLFILFEGGLHIRIRDLMRSMYGATTLAVVNFVLTVIVLTSIATYFGWSLTNALLLGTILGGTSAAVVVPIVRKLTMGKGNSLVLILESAFTDVLCIVATLTLIQIINLSNVSVGGVLNSLFGSFAIAIFVGGLAGFLWIMLLERFTALTKSYMSTVGVLLLVFALTEFAQSSGAIAALAFGIVMGNSRKILSLAEGEDEPDPLTASAKDFFSQISFFVKTFFFVYIGILISLTELQPILIGAIITVTIFIIRPLSVKFAYKPEDNVNDKPIMEAMVPRGLAAAVLAQVPIQQGIPNSGQILSSVFSTIFFTIILTTIVIFLISQGKYSGTSNLIGKLFGRKNEQVMKDFKQKGKTPKKAAKRKRSKKRRKL